MRTLVFVSIAALALASGSTAHAQAPSTKPATGSTGSTAAKPSTGPSAKTGATQAATPATGTTAAKPQTPAPATKPAAPATPPPAPPAATAPPPPPSSDAYTYQTEGRRDPFLALVGGTSGETGGAGRPRPLGLAGMTVAEIQVRGIVQSRSALVAMILGSDNKTYIAHQGDKLLDGTIKTIIPLQGLIITQEVNDPLSLVKQREVRKLLRSLEDAK